MLENQYPSVQAWFNECQAQLQTRQALREIIDGSALFVLTGKISGVWHLDTAREPYLIQQHGRADCTWEIPGELFFEIINERKNLQIAFLEDELKVSGAIEISHKLVHLFAYGAFTGNQS